MVIRIMGMLGQDYLAWQEIGAQIFMSWLKEKRGFMAVFEFQTVLCLLAGDCCVIIG